MKRPLLRLHGLHWQAALLACAGLALATAAHARSATRAINPAALPPAHGYSHVVIAPIGRMVSISGQVAMDRSGKVVGTGDFRAQCEQVFKEPPHRTAQRRAGLQGCGTHRYVRPI